MSAALDDEVVLLPREIRLLAPLFNPSRVGTDEEVRCGDTFVTELKLAAIIGKQGSSVPAIEARQYIAGFTAMNDLGTHTALGPYLVTPDEVDITAQTISTTVNGQKVQESTIDLLIFPIQRLIATISEFTELRTGDLILTGTPSGVGHRRTPPLYLKSGDVVTVEVTGVGALRNTIA